ncbi:uncharacterized protein VTP21DRAFT_1509 [Calcarisporiella thermophila]|uniref:uncharacterized protein n=1 Tax=Calcarisporiella thermophila TaxID=911321 RepID=UPI003743C2F2
MISYSLFLHAPPRSRRYYLLLGFILVIAVVTVGHTIFGIYDNKSINSPINSDERIATPESNIPDHSTDINVSKNQHSPILHPNPFAAEYVYPHQCNDFSHLPKQSIPRTYNLRRPKQGRKLLVFHWQQLTYNDHDYIKWNEIENELCPYPSDLIEFWIAFRKTLPSYVGNLPPAFGENWPIGYAPCYFFQLERQSSVKCEQNGIEFELTSNYTRFREADVIYLDYPFYLNMKGEPPYYKTRLLPPRLPNQVWWYSYGRESLAYYPFVSQANLLDRFDLSIGAPGPMHDLFYPLHPISDVSPFYQKTAFSEIKKGKLPIGTSADPVVAIMISNCDPHNKRNDIMKALFELVEVHSYGKCFNNKKLPKDVVEKYDIPENYDTYFGDWPAIKRDVFSRYWFAFTPENSNCVDYVTEKIYDALQANLIPIYLGASNIREFVPENSVIVVNDYEDMNALAAHLRELMQDEKKLAKYFEWKTRPQSEFCKKCNKNIFIRKECQLLDRVNWVE